MSKTSAQEYLCRQMSRLANRQKTADLIIGVLTGQILVREALLKFPSTTDKSVECAWHALVHLEADEDIRARDAEYKEAQDEYLMFLADTLMAGKDLPANILKEYKTWHGEAPLPTDETSLWSKLTALFRFIHMK